MIGDWVRRRWTCADTGREVVRDFQITEIRKNGETLYAWGEGGNMGRVENLEPIPLTPEILEKNGLEWNGELWVTDNFLIENGYDYKNRFWWSIFNSPIFPINSVHELQHALRLFGIDKEINL